MRWLSTSPSSLGCECTPLAKPGDAVHLHGLVNAPQRNGQGGTVLPYTGSPARLPVQVGKDQLLIRPTNLTPATASKQRTRQPAQPADGRLLFSATPPTKTAEPLAQQAGRAGIAEELRLRGWAVLPLGGAEAKTVRLAGDVAVHSLTGAGEAAPVELHRLEHKDILSLRPTPLHQLLSLLHEGCTSILGGVAASLELPADYFEPLL